MCERNAAIVSHTEALTSLRYTADTVVVKGDDILEKPLDALDNLRMLAELNDGKVRVQRH